MDVHDTILQIIDDISKEVNSSFKVVAKKKRLNKSLLNNNDNDSTLLPRFCFRTADLGYEICQRLKDNDDAIHLINECFANCTLATYYYIHIEDLRNIILRHKKEGEWSVSSLGYEEGSSSNGQVLGSKHPIWQKML